MSPKAILVFCAQALLAQSVFSSCAGNRGGYGVGGYNGLSGGCGSGLSGGCGSGLSGGYSSGLSRGCSSGLSGGYSSGLSGGCGCGASGVASTGGGLPVSSASPIAPTGVTVLSENVYEGQLIAGGNLPFLGTVALDGVVPTSGTGAVSYGCGDGDIGVGSEAPVYTGIVTPGAVFAPNSPSPAATYAAQALGNLGGHTGYGMGSNAGYGLGGNAGCGLGGNAGYGIGGTRGYGLGGRGCGCGY